MDTHKGYLDNLCRVCTGRAQTGVEIRGKKPAKHAKQYQDSIMILFGIDLHDDQPECHPTKICNTCYRLILNSRNSGEGGMMNLSGS